MLPTNLRTKLFRILRSAPEEKSVNVNEIKDSTCDQNFRASDIKSFPPFSVALCVYGKDNPEWFDEALHSVIDQTVKPDEIVLVVDGPIPSTIQAVIYKYTQICAGGV
ncbi:MAG: hypothetical protein LIO96_03795 [Lachnospiraceae bacterium]|nr:hypothetical protein [Lachnospiraceae bacterium]